MQRFIQNFRGAATPGSRSNLQYDGRPFRTALFKRSKSGDQSYEQGSCELRWKPPQQCPMRSSPKAPVNIFQD